MEWINLEKQQPVIGEIVLCADYFNDFVSLGRGYIVEKDEYDEYLFDLMHIDKVEIDTTITHWMPLPEPPKIDE